MAGYTRNDTSNNIADGNVINASDLDGEYNAIEAAFNESTGHTHDGTSAEGAPITKVGPVQDVEVSATAIQPKTASAGNIDLGASGAQFKDLYVDGLAYIDGLGENLLVNSTNEIQFRDSALKINSSADGQLDIDADTELELTAPTVDINASTSVNISNDLNLDSDSAILSLGADGEVTLTHLHNVGTELKVVNSTTSSVTDLLDLQVESSGTPAVGIGTGLTFSVETASGNVETAGAIRAVATGLTPTAEELDLVFYSMRNGSLTEAFRFDSINDSLSLADNVKATFGAGDDLQIYHDGTASYIKDDGTGPLNIQGEELVLENPDGTNYFRAATDGSVKLYNSGNLKLNTESTGIDVTGTVTADGLTVDSSSSVISTFNGTAATGVNVSLKNTEHEFYIGTNDGNLYLYDVDNTASRFNIASNGDISFYEDTGTTAKFFWDASAEVLGIGTASPTSDADLHIAPASGNAVIQLEGALAEYWRLIGATNDKFIIQNETEGNVFVIEDGKVGIGTNDPDAALTVFGGGVAQFRVGNIGPSSNSAIRISRNDTTVTTGNPLGYVEFGGNDSTSNIDTAFAYVGAEADGAHTAGDNPTALVFGVTADGSGTVGEQMRLSSDGNLGIGTTSPAYNLEVAGSFPSISILDTDTTNDRFRILHNGGSSQIQVDPNNVSASSSLLFSIDGSEAMRIDSSGRALVGTSSSRTNASVEAQLQVEGLGGDTSSLSLTRNSADQNPPYLIFAKSRGSADGAVTAVQNGDDIGRIRFAGADGTDTQNFAAEIVVEIDGTPGSNDMPGRLIFATTADGNASSTERMRIDSDGNVGIGITPTGGGGGKHALDVDGPVVARGGVASNQTSAGALDFVSDVLRVRSWGATSGTGEIAFRTGGGGGSVDAEAMRIDSSGNVGIGSSPEAWGSGITAVDVGTYASLVDGSNVILSRNAYYDTGWKYKTTDEATSYWQEQTGKHTWKIAASGTADTAITWTDAMTLTSDGDLLVGTTDTTVYDNSTASSASNGHNIRADGKVDHARYTTTTAAPVLGLNRVGSDGYLAEFRKDGSPVGSIGTINTGNLFISGNSSHVGLQFGSSAVTPMYGVTDSDNTVDLGALTIRFDDVYATNGTIQTSDRNEKQDIEELSEAEQRVAVAAKSLLRKFRWIDSVEEKGDDARIHFGIIAQDLQAAFEAEGLDAGRYAMFIHSTWTDEETGEERSRMGVRYSELLAFIIAAI